MKPPCLIATWTLLNIATGKRISEKAKEDNELALPVHAYAAASKTAPSLQVIQAWTQPEPPRIRSTARQASHQRTCSWSACTLGNGGGIWILERKLAAMAAVPSQR